MKPRILVIDDEESVLKLIHEALCPMEKVTSSKSKLLKLSGALYQPGQSDITREQEYSVTLCSQGEQGVDEVKRSVIENRPFSLVFLDMRMPPGKDGLWTAKKIREFDQISTILIMTAFTNVDPAIISEEVLPADKLLYLQKPLRPQEIRQFARAFSEKWKYENELFNANLELASARKHLEELLIVKKGELQNTDQELDRAKEALDKRESELTETNIAMKVLMKNIGSGQENFEDKAKELDEKVVLNIKELTEPFLDRLANTDLDEEQAGLVTILKNNLDKATSSAMHRLYSSETNLTPSEIQVANLIKQGKMTKEISTLLNVSVKTIDFHRDNIRKKLGIKNRKTSLKSVIQSL